jgi:hypothetical protein
MITSIDIKRLKKVFPTREEVGTRNDLERMDERISRIESKIDTLVTNVGTLVKDNRIINEQRIITAYRLEKHGEWIKKTTKKISIPYQN